MQVWQITEAVSPQKALRRQTPHHVCRILVSQGSEYEELCMVASKGSNIEQFDLVVLGSGEGDEACDMGFCQ